MNEKCICANYLEKKTAMLYLTCPQFTNNFQPSFLKRMMKFGTNYKQTVTVFSRVFQSVQSRSAEHAKMGNLSSHKHKWRRV